jgi:hypothetical protein
VSQMAEIWGGCRLGGGAGSIVDDSRSVILVDQSVLTDTGAATIFEL